MAVPSAAAVLCDSAASTSMRNPPLVREVSVNVPDRQALDRVKQIAIVSVTVRGESNPTVSSLQVDGRAVRSENTRDKDDPSGVRVYQIMNPPVGHQMITITYDTQPSADAVVVAICTGLKPGAPVGSISKTPTADRREVLALTGDDDSTEELSVIGSDGTKAELTMEAPGLRFFSRGEVGP